MRWAFSIGGLALAAMWACGSQSSDGAPDASEEDAASIPPDAAAPIETGVADAPRETGCSPLCGLGAGCQTSTDCASLVCSAGVCGHPVCAPACANGAGCSTDLDCASEVCSQGKCAPPSCAPACAEQTPCGANTDCVSGRCAGDTCASPACSPDCPTGSSCSQAAECASGVCTDGKCAGPACSPDCPFGDACSTDEDCGSATCTMNRCANPACSPTCPDQHPCGEASDCVTGICTNGFCGSPICAPQCPDQAVCGGAGDCASGVCTSDACASPACAPDCPQDNVCGADGDCHSGHCAGGLCATPSCAPTCRGGATCYHSTDCKSGVCTAGRCVDPLSCDAILQAMPGSPDGVYQLQSTTTSSYNAYCDMTDDGGGWTLVMKIDGTENDSADFYYDSGNWSTGGVLNQGSNNLTQVDAMFDAYNVLPFTNILVMMAPLGGAAPTASLVLPIGDTTSMLHLMAGPTNTVKTNLGAAAWKSLTSPAATTQMYGCGEGINVTVPAPGNAADYARVRIGFLASSVADCSTADSYVGFGGEIGQDYSCNPSSFMGTAAGSMGGSACSGGNDVPSFGYVFVR